MPRVFITSREGDADVIARQIERDLIDAFGFDNVLNDRVRLQPGLDIRGELARRLTHSHTLLVIIGRFWENDARLHSPADTVNLSLQLGLKAVGLRVIPILVEGAVMPMPDRLPMPLQDLVHRASLSIREKPDYIEDFTKLIQTIEHSVVEDHTYASTPARIETIAKPPSDLQARLYAENNPDTNAVIERVKREDTTRGGSIGYIFRLIRKLIGDFFGFIFSLIGTAMRQMVKSTVAFFFGILLTVLTVIMVVLFAISLINNNFDLSATLVTIQEQISLFIQNVTAGS